MRRALLSAVAAIAVPAGWMVASSAILCAGLGKTDQFVWPYTQWLDAAPWWRTNWWLALMVGISAAVPTAAAALIGYGITRNLRRTRRLTPQSGGGTRQTERGPTDNHGHATWATPGQVARRFPGPGCLIGSMDRSPNARLIFDDTNAGPGHSLIFAGPGSHKTTSSITRLWHWQGPRVVFDPSCEIAPIMNLHVTRVSQLRLQGILRLRAYIEKKWPSRKGIY